MALYYQIDNVASPIDFQGKDIRKRTLQNAKNLLMCRFGEVPYDRLRGFNPALYEQPIEIMNANLMRELDRVMAWEPDVTVSRAEATLLDGGQVYIKVILLVGV